MSAECLQPVTDAVHVRADFVEKADDEDLTIWEDNWDDDNIEDDFCKQLKSELEKQKMDVPEQMQ